MASFLDQTADNLIFFHGSHGMLPYKISYLKCGDSEMFFYELFLEVNPKAKWQFLGLVDTCQQRLEILVKLLYMFLWNTKTNFEEIGLPTAVVLRGEIRCQSIRGQFANAKTSFNKFGSPQQGCCEEKLDVSHPEG